MPYIFSFKAVHPPSPIFDLVQTQTSRLPACEIHNSSNSTALEQASKLPEILILTSQPGRHLPMARKKPQPGREPVFRDLKAPSAEDTEGRSLLTGVQVMVLNSCWLNGLISQQTQRPQVPPSL